MPDELPRLLTPQTAHVDIDTPQGGRCACDIRIMWNAKR
jgi:hypothetical protein